MSTESGVSNFMDMYYGSQKTDTNPVKPLIYMPRRKTNVSATVEETRKLLISISKSSLPKYMHDLECYVCGHDSNTEEAFCIVLAEPLTEEQDAEVAAYLKKGLMEVGLSKSSSFEIFNNYIFIKIDN
jgi:hypothetical protein